MDDSTTPKKRPRGCLRWFGIGAAVFVVLIIVVAIAGSGEDEESTETTGETETTEGPITNSGNTENPPVNDVSVSQCGPGVGNEAGGDLVGAAGTITNHSSEPSNYLFTIEFVTADGTRYDEMPGSANVVAAGQTVEWQLPTLSGYREGTECRVTGVERFAA